jgi:hypothetical protein
MERWKKMEGKFWGTTVISRDMIIYELKEWGWTENVKKDSVTIFCDELGSEVERVVRQEEVRGEVGPRIPPRIRHMSARLQECVITSDDVVNEEGELVNYAFYADVEPVNAAETLKHSKWMKAMNEELKSIEVNNTWSLVKFSQDKKAIDVKWVYKVKLEK